MLQWLNRFRKGGSALAPTHVASQDIIDWLAMVDAWQILGETDPTECPAACLVSTWRPSTRRTYTSHLRRFAQFGGAVRPGDMQALAEKVLLSMFAQGQKASVARGCISARKAVATLGWIPPLQWDRLWRLSKAAVDSPGQRQFGGPNLLQLMAESCSGLGEWKIYAAAVLSFATLCRVGEISSLRRPNISKVGVTYQGIKRDHRQITRRLGPYVQAWASWLRRIAPGEATALGRATDLQSGMAKLLQGTDRGEARWNASRRAGATCLRWLVLPWRHLLAWGRWYSIKIAHLYASPPDEFECVQITRLPWVANEGILWRKTDIRDFWPSSLVELFENDDTVRKSPTEVKRTRSTRGDGGAKKDNTAGERAVGNRRPEGGGQKSRRTDATGTTEARTPEDIRPPGGTRSVDPMPALGRASSASQDTPDTSGESPIAVDEQRDVEMGPPPRQEADGGAKPSGPVRAGGRFQGRPRGFTTWRTRPRTTAGLGAKHLAGLVRRAAGTPVTDDCPRERAVESVIQSERGQRWLDEISQGRRLSDNFRDFLHRQTPFLFIQRGRVARDGGCR